MDYIAAVVMKCVFLMLFHCLNVERLNVDRLNAECNKISHPEN